MTSQTQTKVLIGGDVRASPMSWKATHVYQVSGVSRLEPYFKSLKPKVS